MKIDREIHEDCRFCVFEGHDRVFMGWATGELSSEEIGAMVGLGESAWLKHLRRHIPGYRTLVDQVNDLLDRPAVLDLCIHALRRHLLALSDKAGDPSVAAAVEKCAARLNQLTNQRERTLQHRKMYLVEIEAKAQGDGWVELEAFQKDLMERLRAHPDVWKELMDEHYRRRRQKASAEAEAPKEPLKERTQDAQAGAGDAPP
jgi:hypothetical protein